MTANGPDWQARGLRPVCECQVCERAGPQSSHHDDTHDQALSQRFTIAGRSLQIHGGTTKCARVLSRWFEQHAADLGLATKDVVEVGSGTGLVGLALAQLGARSVILTDQEPVLDIVQDSIDRNDCGAGVQARALYWGDAVPADLKGKALVIGSDLIFAKENIPLLLATFDQMCTTLSQNVVFAHIDRFDWEAEFFAGMTALRFETELLASDDDIRIYRFRRTTKDSCIN